MVQVQIRGIDVNFPFQPYGCQVSYMEKVIQCLQEKKNGILESPTGTGKTLCLLCATLAWRETYVAQLQLQQRLSSDQNGSNYVQTLGDELKEAAYGQSWGVSSDDKASFFEAPRILYASRTHSQLSQAVQELKNTIYRPKVSIIGSREQLCVNNDVLKQETNSAKVHMCRAKVQARTCHFYNNLEGNKANKDFTQGILDIEDLVELGKKHRACPYYMARELKTGADIIFMPYNYLLDAKSRKANSLDISGSIILFDEAHNVEKTCEESASFDLTSFDIASCIEDIAQCIELIECREQNELAVEEGAADVDINKEDLAHLKSLFIELEKLIDGLELPKSGEGLTRPGSFMFELLSKLNISYSTKDQVLEVLEKCNSVLVGDTRKFKGKHFALQKFSDALQVVFSKDPSNAHGSADSSKLFKVHIQLEADNNKKKKNLDVWTAGSNISKQGRTLSYWCFSPGHAMRELASYGLRSVVLTSGTLSPLSSFRAEMQISFPVQLENPHVIEHHQMMVGVVTKAPDGATLNSSYETRFTVEYMTGLGNAVVNYARTVPNGLLVFFPSYPVMNKCLEHWQNSGTWSRLEQHKPIFAEPKGKGDFVETMERFYEKINDPNYNAATFFAVCRGKVSEGLDFADINGRAVVITGLPFPPKMDPKVRLKMSFLDDNLQKNKSSSKGLSGRQWYRQQASRAVNQAVGRVIRHKNDFGAILLCDVRFTYPDAIQQLPLWMRPYVKVYNEFGAVQRDLIHFFRTADKMVDKSYMKVKALKKHCIKTEVVSPSMISTSTGEKKFNPPTADTGVQRTKRADMTFTRGTINKSSSDCAEQCAAPVSSHRLKYEYKSGVLRESANTVKQASLIDSLTNSESNREGDTRQNTPEPKERTLSEAIMMRKETKAHFKPKKVIKLVKNKVEIPNQNELPQTLPPSKAEKFSKAKEYILKVKQTLSDNHYRTFSQVLAEYKQNRNLDSLIDGLRPLFTRTEDRYPLFLGFSSYIRDPADKRRFFEAYTDLTNSDIPAGYIAGLKIRKREDSRFEIDGCKVIKKRKTEEIEQTTETKKDAKMIKTEGKTKAGKPLLTTAGLLDADSEVLNIKNHLNWGT
ncbi:regulator of telomere elongation helicase 1-like [Acropora millepora]|uniref:regulator of telomere elongation helicase 1-like n=1 Tax=Acropora millepora TaxID=45264 RepID=UPI001CF30659|nr:regulator of telomere elongation helicase 1-like [Acropora millepora]